MSELDKEFRLKKADAADFLRDLADQIESGDKVVIDGDEWKAYQPLAEIVPMRIYSDKKGLELGLKFPNPDKNTE